MKKTMLLLALSSVFAGASPALASSTVEAYLSASSFDGQTFNYKYTAYDTDQVLAQNVKVSCQYSPYQDGQILSSVEVKVMITADFNKPGSQIEKKGQFDIRQSLDTCMMEIPGGLKTYESPVQVKLPVVSISSRAR